MARRHAVLMKLRNGVTRAEVNELCNLLRRIGDPEWLTNYKMVPTPDGPTRAKKVKDRDKTNQEMLDTYNDEHGEPVWYVP